MKITDKRLYQSTNFKDFLFRLRYNEEDNRLSRMAISDVEGMLEQGFIAPDTNRIWGIDVSPWDGNVNLQVTKDFGASFVFIKAMDGTVPVPYWLPNTKRAQDVGLLNSPYGWLYPDNRVSCVLQAREYWNLIKDVGSNLPPVIDFEWTRYAGVQANPNYSDLNKWADEFNRISGGKSILYSAAGYMNLFGPMPPALRAKFAGFWFASYGGTRPTYPTGFTSEDIWQFSAFGDAQTLAPGDRNKKELDMNYMQSSFYEKYGGAPTPPPPAYQKIRRFASDCHVLVIDPVTQRVHVTNTRGQLETVSSAAKRLGARYAVNGDGWWNVPCLPLSLAASDGDVYQPEQYDLRPFLNVTQDGKARLGWFKVSDLYNTVSGTRELVADGLKAPYLAGTDPQYTERHPRTAAGVRADGHLVLVVVDGRSTVSAGVTLSELADILIEFGCVDGLELDGGGSSAIFVDGAIANVPSDGHERPVVNHVLIGGVTMTKNKVTITWDAGARERQKPRVSTADTYGAVLADNTVHYSDFDVVNDLDEPTNPDKKWIQLGDWFVAVRYPSSSGIVERARVEAIVTPPVVAFPPEIYVSMTADGEQKRYVAE